MKRALLSLVIVGLTTQCGAFGGPDDLLDAVNLGALAFGAASILPAGSGISLTGQLTDAGGTQVSGVSVSVADSAGATGEGATDSAGNWTTDVPVTYRDSELTVRVMSSGNVLGVFVVRVRVIGTDQVAVTIIRVTGTLQLQCNAALYTLDASFIGLKIQGGPTLTLTEGGAPGVLSVSLTERPGELVTVRFSARGWVSAAGVSTLTGMPAVAITPPTLLFTHENYATPQQISVSPEQDLNGLDESGFLAVSTAFSPAWRALALSIKVTDDDNKFFFITATGYISSFGGPVAADAACMSDSKYPGTGTYKAMIVTPQTSSPKRIACSSAACTEGAGGRVDWVLRETTTYRRAVDGIKVFNTDAHALITYPLFAIPAPDLPPGPSSSFWTGMLGPGGPEALGVGYGWRAGEDLGAGALTTCNGWTGVSTYVSGHGGDPTNSSGLFLTNGGGACVLASYPFGGGPSQVRFLCVEQ